MRVETHFRLLTIGLALTASIWGCTPPAVVQEPTRTAILGNQEPLRVAVNRVPIGSFTKLIILIHGVFGDAASTWTHTAGTSWQSLLAQDPRFSDYGTLVVDYPTPKLERASGIEEISNGVLLRLKDEGVFDQFNDIYLIGHSMGGLIAKRILIDLNRPTQVDKLRRVRAVFYVSTPAQGAPLAELGTWLSANPQLKDMGPSDLNSFLQLVENMWQNLMSDRPGGSNEFPRAYCAYETRPTGGVMVVSRVYAATRCDETPLGVTADHIDIVKPRDDQDQVFRWVAARILRTSPETPSGVVEAIPTIPKQLVRREATGIFSEYMRSIVRVSSINSTGTPVMATGFLFSSDGQILTAAHVIPPGSTQTTIRFTDGMHDLPVSLVQRDENSDLAVLRLGSSLDGRTPLPLASAGTIPVASRLSIIGLDVTHRDIVPMIMEASLTSASADGFWRISGAGMVAGQSGSPVVDDRGVVIGIVKGSTDVSAGRLAEGIVVPVSSMAPIIRGSPAFGAARRRH